MRIEEDDYLAHYGVLRRSGRYPWGSGGNQSAINKSFLETIAGHRKEGISEPDIAKMYGLSTTELRSAKTVALAEQRQSNIGQAQRLKDKGYSPTAIGQRLGMPESTVRSLLAPGAQAKAAALTATSDMLKGQVAKKKFIDVGSGTENQMGISETKLKAAVHVLKEQGYEVHSVKVPQVGTGQMTKYKVLCPPGVTSKEAWINRFLIQQVQNFSDDGGLTYFGIHPPLKIHPDRVGINYGPEGGAAADGVIYVRPGVKDVSIGGSQYAQVRVSVGPKHYLKGMAMYKDGLPPGVDLVFNTNKARPDSGNKLEVMKEYTKDEQGKVDKDNPFGSQIKRQIVEKNTRGNEKVTSAMNIVQEEGDWKEWNKNLSSQMLSKQQPSLAKRQLSSAYEDRVKEFEKLTQLTNPAVRKKLLETFGDETTKASVHLKAAALNTRQATHVILPVASMKPGEIYAPNYENGTSVVLIRHPHAGIFEIPRLVVNNKQPEAKALLGNARDAVGIHSSVADHLSGADFDGDTVIVIPDNKNQIKTSPALLALKGFDPKHEFPAYPGMPKMSPKTKQQEMGYVSNLITDMTLKNASHEELARAVRHSMVVIDAEKHNLNYKESARVNGIAALNLKYQGKARGGASTIISRAGSQQPVNDRVTRAARDGGPIDKGTGKRVFTDTNRSYVNIKGKTVVKTIKSKKLAETEDANTLLSGPNHEGTPMERIYADHSNKLKVLGDQARKESVNTPPVKYSPTANKAYSHEVASLNAKLQTVVANRPRERMAQLYANRVITQKRAANPNMESDTLKKVRNQSLAEGRRRMGATGHKIVIDAKEWQAIQAGAISNHKLGAILDKSDLEVVRAHAAPRPKLKMTSASTARAQAMLNAGATRAEVAKALGVSITTLDTTTNVKG